MLKMKVGFSQNPRLEPLIDGTVKPKNIQLEFVLASPGELFYRNLMRDEFDLFEMSISEYLMVLGNPGQSTRQWSGLPVFPRKAFNWLNLCVHVGAGIKSPADLKGKRFGVPDYPMTASLWMRIVFQELYGIRPSDVAWFIGRGKESSHGGVFDLDKNPPPGVRLNWLSDDEMLDVMLDRGELDAAFWIVPTAESRQGAFPAFDRYGGTRIEGNPRMRRLFPDGGRAVIAEYFHRTGIVPANHMVVLQSRIVREHPWTARELYRAFTRSRDAAYENARCWSSAYLFFPGEEENRQAGVFGAEPYPYGVEKNRNMLERMIQSSFEEGLIARQLEVDELFDRSTLDT